MIVLSVASIDGSVREPVKDCGMQPLTFYGSRSIIMPQPIGRRHYATMTVVRLSVCVSVPSLTLTRERQGFWEVEI